MLARRRAADRANGGSTIVTIASHSIRIGTKMMTVQVSATKTDL
jgi:hypothetical protein